MWSGTGRLEFRKQSQLERWLGSLGFTRKLNRNWSALGRTTWLTVPDEDRVNGKSQVGVAYRQTDHNVLNALARYENRYDQNGGPAPYRKYAHIFSAHANLQAARALTLSGQLAAKWAEDDHGAIASPTKAQLAAGRAQYDLGRNLDLGVTARGLSSGGHTYGFGAEFGWVMMKNLRMAAGYNAFGFRDPDMTGVDRTDRGPYFNFGLKLDETWLDRGAPGGKQP